MFYQNAVVAFAAISSVLAAPLEKKADYNPLPGGDVDILNYALTLEFLERKFYREGLTKYTEADFANAGFGGDFYTNLKEIAFDEKSHVSLLSGALGAKAIPEPSFAFPDKDAQSFVALASVLEGVGVSAYLGAAAVIADKTYVPIAGSILTVEARHSSYIRAALKQSPYPKPYDTPLDFNQVYSLAAQFVTGFAKGTPKLPFKAFAPLTATPADKTVVAGKTAITFTGAAKNAKKAGLAKDGQSVYAVFYSGLDTYYAKVECHGDDYWLAHVPGSDFSMKGQLPPTGQVYVVLSTADGKMKASDENTISGVAIVEVVKSVAETKKDLSNGELIHIDV